MNIDTNQGLQISDKTTKSKPIDVEIAELISSKLNLNYTSNFKANLVHINNNQVLSNDDMEFYDEFLSKIKEESKIEQGITINMRPRNNQLCQTQSKKILQLNQPSKSPRQSPRLLNTSLFQIQSMGEMPQASKMLSEDTKSNITRYFKWSNNEAKKQEYSIKQKEDNHEYKNISIISVNKNIFSNTKAIDTHFLNVFSIQRIKTIEELSLNYNSEKNRDQEQKSKKLETPANDNNQQLLSSLNIIKPQRNSHVVNSNANSNKRNSIEKRNINNNQNGQNTHQSRASLLQIHSKKKKGLLCCLPIRK